MTKPLPSDFLLQARIFAGDEYDSFINSLSKPSPVSIRINPFKREGIFEQEEKIPWSEDGRYLKERPSFTLDPLFHAGCYYVQDASSQFLEQPFNQVRKIINRPLRILDLCAAPGGKSTHVLSLINNQDLLVSNEIIPARNNVLRQNVIKWGQSNVIVTQNDPADFSRLDGFFDIVIVDAPCSGEGLFRKDENAREEWSIENVNQCAVRQEGILKHAYSALSPGGFLIYSTCTFEDVENDKQIETLIDNYKMTSIPISFLSKGIVKTKFGLIFFPHKVKGEGFYLSLLQKEGENIPVFKKVLDKTGNSDKKYLERFLDKSDNFYPLLKDERLFAIPYSMLSAFSMLNRSLYIRLAGVYVGDFKGEELIPSYALALSNDLKKDIPFSELALESTLEYLRGGNPIIETTKGWALIKYHGFNLGWVKNIGNRINNYYPKEWRIKMSVR
jgi:16S rRNA C967 or C1407 C5-methylase (RsmB/RsmF family)/NOL1/NOP2/fmu family ribosome biogenesis protein